MRYTQSWLRPAAEEDAPTYRVWESTEGPPSHSTPAHLAAKAAARLGPESFAALHARLLRAYFEESRDISRLPVLTELWADAGLPEEGLAALDDPELLRRTAEEHNEALQIGITGVPAVRVAGTDAYVVGAQPLATYRRWIERLLEGRPRRRARLSDAVDDAFRLDGRVAVVTGASSGMGVTFAEAVADAGARVVIAARREDRLAAVADGLRERGAEVAVVPCDVAREEDVDALVGSTLAAFGQVDVLVNNAGFTTVVPAEEQTVADWRGHLDVNLTGVFLCAQRFGRVMLEAGRGNIVNVASVLGLVAAGQIKQAAYAASKGGVVNLTRELAAQWARRGIRVNALAPGWFPTEMTGEMFGDERSEKWMRGRTPMGRGGELDELRGPLLFLASEASTFVTGQVLAVDGGWTIV